MKQSSDMPERKNDLQSLLFLLMIFSMYLVFKLHSLPRFLFGSSVTDIPQSVFTVIMVPLIMGIALLFAAIYVQDNSLKYIYLISILPFIFSPEVLYFCNHLLVMGINIVLTFIIILFILRHINKNYHKRKNV